MSGLDDWCVVDHDYVFTLCVHPDARDVDLDAEVTLLRDGHVPPNAVADEITAGVLVPGRRSDQPSP